MRTALLASLRRAAADRGKRLNIGSFFNPVRELQTKLAEPSESVQGISFGAQKPVIVPFQLSKQEAEKAFEAWHQRHTFSPSGLLQHATAPTRAAYLPFWLFRAQFKVEYSGQVGFKKTNNDTEWEEVPWRDKGTAAYEYTSSSTQVYASYRYRRDFVEALATSTIFHQSEPLSQETAEELEGKGELDSADVKQSIAWHLACKAVRQKETDEAKQVLISEYTCDSARDVQVRLKTLRRSARLVFLPAFVLDYQYGEMFDAHGNRKPHSFQAFISGAHSKQVVAERHFSPMKVQVGAGLAMGSATGLAIFAGVHGQETFSLASSFLSALLICTSAGLAARLAPEIIRQSAEDERIQVEESDMERIMSQGLGPQDIMDDKHETIRATTEWRRWEEANKWAWDRDRRSRWAESIWQRQQSRKLRLAEYARNKAKADAKYKSEQENEARRRARYGTSSSRHYPQFSDGSGRADFKGYYALLGLDGSLRQAISEADIKTAYRKVAMRWHPDKLQVDSAQDREKAYSQFAKVQRAYSVLQDKGKRSQYDGGTDPPEA